MADLEIQPISATPAMPTYSMGEPLIDRPLVKQVVKILPKDEIQQTTVRTYDKWGRLENTTVYGNIINNLA